MLFNSDSAEEWDAILDKYSIALDHHVASKKDDALAGLDEWYQSTLPAILATRKPQSIDSSELCKLMSWKLKVRKQKEKTGHRGFSTSRGYGSCSLFFFLCLSFS